MQPEQPTVFITGCSSGLGRALAEVAARRGYRVAATARKPEDLAPLSTNHPELVHALELDVTDEQSVRCAVQAAHEALGSLDIVILNSGRGLLGALEELGEEQIQASLDVNLLGPLRVLREVVPIFRKQRSGAIVNISAIAAFCNHPGFTVYGAAKAGVEAMCDGLRAELAPIGVQLMSVEPGPFRTSFISKSLERATSSLPEYASTVGKFGVVLNSIDGKQTGDPARAAEAIFEALGSPKLPSRLVLGKYAYSQARQRLAQLTHELDQWESVGAQTDFR